MTADAPLLLLVLEKGLLSSAELEQLLAARGPAATEPVTLGGHLALLRRVTPDALPGLVAEAQARTRTCPRCARISLGPLPGAPPRPCPGCGHTGEAARPPSTASGSRAFRGAEPATLQHETVVDPRPALPLPPPASPVDAPGSGSSRWSGLPAPPRFETGARVGRYELVQELGRGAMGAVFRVRDERGQEWALKLLLGGAQASPGRRRRFEEELRVLLRLDHPHLIKLHDCGLAGGAHPFYVMELRRGHDLRERLRRGPLAPSDAARVVAQLARGLEHAHAQGVLHRDIKPDNVLVDAQLSPTLVDFGLAKDLELESDLTRSGTLLGTPHYMAPEQALGRVHQVDARSDVWALGVVLYELLCGQTPWRGDGAQELAARIVSQDPPPLRGQGVPRALERICLRALQKPPAARWQSAGELAGALEAFLAGEAPEHDRWPLRVAVLAGGLGLVLLGVLLAGRGPRGEAAAGPAATDPAATGSSANPAAPLVLGEGPDAARALAAAGRLPEAIAALGLPAGVGEGSFVRAERASWLRARAGEATGAALRALGAAEAGADRSTASLALELLQDPGCAASPAAQEGRARAALLLGRADEALQAAQAAQAAAPGDPQAARTLTRARACALGPRALALDLARLEGHPDPGGETALAGEWERLAASLSETRAREPEGAAGDGARLEAALAWEQAGLRHSRAAQPAQAEACHAHARDELAPLLGRIDPQPLRAARRALVQAPDEPALHAAEAALAAAARDVPPVTQAAARLAARLEGPAARGWAEVWLGLAGDLPARAILALVGATGTKDPLERSARLDRAISLAPGLPLMRLESLRLARGGSGAGSPENLRALVALLALEPGLSELALHSLRLSPLAPPELQAALNGLAGDDRDALLGRALACVHSRDPARAALERAADEAHRAGGLDPGCALAHWLEAQALTLALGEAARAQLRGDTPLRRALRCAEAAAPEWIGPHLLRLRITRGSWEAVDLEPLFLRGYLQRSRTTLARGEAQAPRLPAEVEALLGGQALDFTSAGEREAFLGRLEEQARTFPVLAIAAPLAAVRAHREWGRSPVPALDRALSERAAASMRLLSGLDPRSPERWQAEVELTLARQPGGTTAAAQAALRALSAAEPAGGSPWPAPGQLLASQVPARTLDDMVLASSPFPDAPQLPWAWFTAPRRPDLLTASLARARGEARAGLDPGSLAEPWSLSRALVEAAQDDAVQACAADALLCSGERAEAYLALVRAAAYWTNERKAETAFGEWVETIAEPYLAWRRTPTEDDLLLLLALAREALLRFGERPGERAAISACAADLWLLLAGLRAPDSPQRAEALREARQALDAAPGPRLREEEPTWWTHWRRARVNGLEGDLERAEHECKLAREALRASGAPQWRLRALRHDPLRAPLERVPGYAKLVEQAGPER